MLMQLCLSVLLTVISLIVFICTVTYELINDDDDDDDDDCVKDGLNSFGLTSASSQDAEDKNDWGFGSEHQGGNQLTHVCKANVR